MNIKQIRLFIKLTVITAVLFLLNSCTKYDASPFTGKILPRITGYTTGVSNDWIYFNLRTGEIYNKTRPKEDIEEGAQYDSTNWDLAFCSYHMRTNSGSSGKGKGGAIDLGYDNYDKWESISQIPQDAVWTIDDSSVYVTYSQVDWYHHLVVTRVTDFDEYPWFDPNSGIMQKKSSGNPLLNEAIALSGPPMAYTPSYHTYVIRTADGAHYFKLQIVSWYNTNTEIDDTGGQMSYYCEELK